MIVVGWGNTKQTYIVWRFMEGWEMKGYERAFDQTANLVQASGSKTMV